MNETIRPITLAESADIAAQRAADTLTHEANPHPLGSPDYLEWHRIYCVALLGYSASAEVAA